MNPVLEARKISKLYQTAGGTVAALAEISFVASPSELVVIVGPSGAGKSTLINVLSTLDSPSTGTVLYRGQNLFDRTQYDVAQLRNSDFGFIFQTPYLLGDRTVLENVALPFLYGAVAAPTEVSEKCLAMLDYVGLAGLAQRYPQSLSGGEMQRVVFARALVRRPRVIFADEPTGSLDSDNSERILALLKAESARGCTVIMVTHDARAIDYGDRIVTMDKV